jgi:hypothetical protein
VSWLAATLALYRRAFGRAAALTARNWPVLGSLFVYTFIMDATIVFAPLLGILGGFLVSLVWSACVGSFLYLVEMMVRTSRVTLEDFRRSFGAYLWDVVGVTFVVWIALRLLGAVLATTPQGPVLLLAVELAAFVFFNAVPELIYLGRCTPLELLGQSYAFIGENWIEWFPATLALGALVLGVETLPLPGALGWIKLALVALLVAFAMVVRGLLFLELEGSTRRARAFRHRMGA